jgi:SAM-dependent methyltransferase
MLARVMVENKSAYHKFKYIKNYTYDKGWDKYAEDYSRLLKEKTIYYLTKEVAHKIVSNYISPGKGVFVLDLNCGTGNDFPFFLKNQWNILGCDGSTGMLNKAYELYETEIKNNQIELFHGQLEDLDNNSFGNRKFDLIYSITGGYSYIDDAAFVHVNSMLSGFLKKDGIMITAHLNNFCLADILYNFITLKFKKTFLRLDKNLKVNIKGVEFRMYLRNVKELKKLTPSKLNLIHIFPLLAFTPPYQTGYHPPKTLYNFHRKLEMLCFRNFFLSRIADQIVLVYKK